MAKNQMMETVLRDGQQSLIATRMTTADMLPILKTMDQSRLPFIRDVGRRYF